MIRAVVFDMDGVLVDAAALFEEALNRALRLLAPGGAFVGKLFQGPDFEALRKRLQARFEEVKVVKPPSSRAQSIEIFLAARGFGPET